MDFIIYFMFSLLFAPEKQVKKKTAMKKTEIFLGFYFRCTSQTDIFVSDHLRKVWNLKLPTSLGHLQFIYLPAFPRQMIEANISLLNTL